MISLLQESVGLNERVTSSLLTEIHASTAPLLRKQQIMDITHAHNTLRADTPTHRQTSLLNVTNTHMHDIVEITSRNNLHIVA